MSTPRVPSCACRGRVTLSPALLMLALPFLTVLGGLLAALVVALVRGQP
jgi:hypothetical protein